MGEFVGVVVFSEKIMLLCCDEVYLCVWVNIEFELINWLILVENIKINNMIMCFFLFI